MSFGVVMLFKLNLIKDGAIKPWMTETYREAYLDLMEFCRNNDIPVDIPYRQLTAGQKSMIIEESPEFYGIRGFFQWLERRTYKMHIRILLSKYRDYIRCTECNGTRFQPETLNY